MSAPEALLFDRPYPVLENGFVRLEPLAYAHRAQLAAACNADSDIWQIYPYCMAGDHFARYWDDVMARLAARQFLPLAVLQHDICVGVTCYLRPDWPNRTIEIGGTYYHPDFRGGPVNPSCKFLMLDYAFSCGIRRVQFRVDAINARSRAAVTKLGAVQEGICRQDMVTWTGRIRDTVVYSILQHEWPDIRTHLEQRLIGFGTGP
jgi:RimJ/RimL family protein N-acetyltransferase